MSYSLSGHTGLLLVNINDFRQINNTVGNSSGDEVLEKIHHRIEAAACNCIHKTLTARLNGNEFAIAVYGIDASEELLSISQMISGSISDTVPLDGLSLGISCSIGASLIENAVDLLPTLYFQAGTALARCRKDHLPYSIYDSQLDSEPSGYLSIMSQLRHALLKTNEVTLHYQPQISSDGTIHCYEALVRWKKPGQPLVQPSSFIDDCERSDLIHILTNYILSVAAADWVEVFSKSSERPSISVNISAHNLSHPTFVDKLLLIQAENNIPRGTFELEITESAIIENSQRIHTQLKRLRREGFRIAIDDFGTGYSSFKTFTETTIDKIKIDQSFIKSITKSKNHAAIVVTLISLAKELGVTVTAEGIEDLDTFWLLKKLHCDFFQGYLIGKPLPPYTLLENEFSLPTHAELLS